MLVLITCTDASRPGGQPTFVVPGLDLRLPKVAGWVVDKSVGIEDMAKGGELFRLIRETAEPGSPRIMVLIAPLELEPTRLEVFLAENLREMTARQTAGAMQILHVDQTPIQIGPNAAYRVRHEYTVGAGPTQTAIRQVSILMVLDGRGMAITAAGRTELFHPLADSIERIIRGVSTPATATPASVDRKQPPETRAAPGTAVEPIDLGRLGGKDQATDR